MFRLIFALLLTLCVLLPAASGEAQELYVAKVENLPEDFILGMDLSSVISLENGGVRFYGFDGAEQDVFKTLADSGITHIRVRVWNDPYDFADRGYGGGNCDIKTACLIGERAARYGLQLIVDFHYSDFWADPGKQMVPKAWKRMGIEEKTQAVYDYTLSSLNALKDAGASIGVVQIGNEINGFMCGEKTWFNITYLIDAGSRATREACPDALVAVHFTNPERVDALIGYAGKLDYYDIDYDVFASSWYPYWHGSLENLARELNKVADKYGKRVMVMETSYAYTDQDTDFFGNTIGEGAQAGYPFTVQGQANLVRDLADTLANDVKNAIGLVYWEGAWISAGGDSWEQNAALWEKYGSGWASSFAASYDPDDAGKYYGGSAVDNQAFFDASGHPLASLKVFQLLRSGNYPKVVPDAIENSFVTCDINGKIALPESVSAVMNDASRQTVPVQWDVDEKGLEALRMKGVDTYEISGRAGGMPAQLYLTLIHYNFLEDWSFEDESGAWRVSDLAKADELYVESKKTDSLTGNKHLHFWSKNKNTVEFTAEQDVKDLTPGAYSFSISIMGGDAGKYDVYAYVKVNGQTVGTAPMDITYYNAWDTGTISRFEVKDGDSVTVGIYVKCEGAGSGAWGKIDDAKLNRSK